MLRKNNKRKVYCVICALLILLSTYQVAGLNIPSDLSYNFSNENDTEFYNGGTKSGYNITEDTPGYVNDIIDADPQTIYNSDFGTNIILPGGDFDLYPAGNKPYNAPETPYKDKSTTSQSNGNSAGSSSGTNNTSNNSSSGGNQPGSGGNSNVTYPDSSGKANQYPTFSYGDEKTNQYKLTPIEQVRKSDGSIGTLTISKINLNITVYDGDTFAAMLKGAGHIASTSAWNGNIGVVGVRPDRALLKVV